MLVSKDSLYSQLPASGFMAPSYSRRTPQPSPCPGGGDPGSPRSLWAFNTHLRVRLLCATYVNVNIRDIDKVRERERRLGGHVLVTRSDVCSVFVCGRST